MTNKGYMAFMPDWWEYKKELTPEQWYELEDYMFQLRFNGIDTETETIQDKEVRLIWRTIRAQLKKIIRNYNYKIKSKGNTDILPNTEFEETPVEEVKIPSVSHKGAHEEEQVGRSDNSNDYIPNKMDLEILKLIKQGMTEKDILKHYNKQIAN